MLISVPVAAKEMGVHPNTIYNFIKRGRIVAFKGPRGWEVLRSSVELLVNDQFRYTSQVEQAVQCLYASKHLINEFNESMVITLRGETSGVPGPVIKTLMRNEKYKAMLQYPEHILRDIQPEDVIHPDDLELAHTTSAILRPGEKEISELRLKRSDFKYIWVSAQATICPLEVGVNLMVCRLKRV